MLTLQSQKYWQRMCINDSDLNDIHQLSYQCKREHFIAIILMIKCDAHKTTEHIANKYLGHAKFLIHWFSGHFS